MRLTRLVATISALCLVTGLIVYGGLFLWPDLAGSTPSSYEFSQDNGSLLYLYSIGDAAGPTRPNSVAVDKRGRVYVTDGGTGKVIVYSGNGRKLFSFGKQGTGKSEFSFPNGIIVTDQGNLMISDSANNDIKLFSPKGRYIKTIVPPSKDFRPGYLFKGQDGLVYVSDLVNHKILVLDEQGKRVRTMSDSKNPLKYPQASALDKMGRLWVADAGNYEIKIFNKKGQVIRKIQGGGKPETGFSMVRGIAFDRWGRAYISDTLSHQIRVFDIDGKQLSIPESVSRPEDKLVFPTSMFVDSHGKLYVVDRGAGSIKVFFVRK